MEALSQKKKIGIIAGAILLLTVVALVSTGRMSLTGLKSDALSSSDYACSGSGQQKKFAQYTNAPANKIKAENNIGIINNEIVVLNGKISAKEVTIGEKQAQIATRPAEIVRINGLIEPLRTYIETNCQNKNTSICKNKIKQKLKLENEIVKLNNLETDITKLQNEIGTSVQSNTLRGKIQLKQNNIATWQRKIDGYNLLITNYESCEAELGVKFYPACSFIFHTLGMDLNTPCENESGKIFQGYPFGQAGVEYRFMLKGSEVKDVSIQSLTFFLGGTDDQKTKFINIRLSTGIETNDVIAQCEKTGDSIHCPLSSPITLKKQDIVYWYLNANIDIAEDHSFTLDAGGINVGGQYDTKNKNQNTKFAFIAYAKSPITGEPGNFNVWETKKDQTIKLGSDSQTLYEFQVKAENGEVAMTDVVLSSEFLEGSGQLPEQFISCADPKLRNQLFDGMLELYDGTKLIATSEDYSQTYTKFNIKNPILIKPNTEKKFTIKANMQSGGVGAQCSFSVIPSILANSGSFSTQESNYITTIKATDASFRYASWTCYNGEKQNEGGTSSCKSQTLWKQYAETFCQNKCSPETGKCGVNNYSNSEQCDDAPSGCGNGIKEGAEQCDDGNTANGDGCDSLCKSEVVNGCNDSDGGENIFKYGEAVIGEQKVQDQCNLKVFNGYNDQYNLVKSCTGSNCVVLEAICDQYSTNDGLAEYARSKIVSCPNGCSDGACITNSQTELAKFSVGASTAVFVNEAFDVSIKVLRADEGLLDTYEGTIQFDYDSADANVTLPATNGQYKFTLADKGVHTFTKGFKINTAGTYKFAVMSTESNIPPTFFTIVAINKTGGTSCTDTDGGLTENTKGTVSGIAWYDEPYTYTDVCNKDADGKEWVSEAYCYAYPEGGAKIYWSAQKKDCPNGCNDGACKTTTPVESCEDLAVSPNMTQGGGTVTYTCQSNTDILCVLDPKYCTPKTYSVVIKKPDGGIVQTSTTATGSITIPSNPTGTYTAECFVNGQTTTIDACKKTITNQAPTIACTGTLPTNATILNNVGNTSRAWTYDGSPTGPYQNCSFKCPTGTVYANNACNAPTGNLLVSLSSATPLTGYATGGSTVVAAVFDFKAENIQHTVKQLKFKVGSSEAASAINSIQLYDGSNTIGSPSFFLGNNATIDALNLAIPANTTKTIIVRLTLNTIGAGAGLSQSNVGLTLDEVSYQNDTNGTLTTNPTDIVANAKYVYKSFPVLTQIAVNTSTKITNGTARDILKFSIAAPVTATTSNGISVKQIRFPISWVDGGGSSDTLEIESLKLSIDGTDITAADITIQDQNGSPVESASGLTESDNYVIVTWDSNKELTIGAGQVRTLTLRGTMQGFNTGDQEINPADSFTIGFEPDYVYNDTKRYLVNHAPTDNIINLSATPDGSSGSVRYSFLWSDNSSAAHTGAINTGSSNDWANSYPILSPFSNQVFTNANI